MEKKFQNGSRQRRFFSRTLCGTVTGRKIPAPEKQRRDLRHNSRPDEGCGSKKRSEGYNRCIVFRGQ